MEQVAGGASSQLPGANATGAAAAAAAEAAAAAAHLQVSPRGSRRCRRRMPRPANERSGNAVLQRQVGEAQAQDRGGEAKRVGLQLSCPSLHAAELAWNKSLRYRTTLAGRRHTCMLCPAHHSVGLGGLPPRYVASPHKIGSLNPRHAHSALNFNPVLKWTISTSNVQQAVQVSGRGT